jgi:hypothetical protein
MVGVVVAAAEGELVDVGCWVGVFVGLGVIVLMGRKKSVLMTG